MAKAKEKAKRAARKVQDADAAVAKAAAPYNGTLPIRALGAFAGLGDQPQLRVLCGAVIAAGIVGGDARLRRAGLRMLAAHTIATWAKDFIKLRVDRTRPRTVAEKGGDHRISKGRSTAKEETSFPSGHSAGAMAVAAAYAREYPENKSAAYAAGGALALAQVPRCAHYPTDIGAGVAIGIAAEIAVDAAFRLAKSED